MTKVLMISTDAKILEEGSLVRGRMIEYGELFDDTRIILLSCGKHLPESVQISSKVTVYSTRSFSKFLYITDATALGQKIIREQGLVAGECVINTQDPFETGMAGYLLSKKSDIPLHVQIHTDFQSPYFKKGVLNTIRIFFSKIVFPKAKAIRAVSERILNSLPAGARIKAAVLPIYADIDSIRTAAVTSDLRKKYSQFSKAALMASRLTKEKDIPSAIRAFALARKSMPGVGLVIVGSGPEEAALKKEVAAFGLNDAVVFEPWADHSTLVSYMKTCDAFISTSHFEGYGLSMLEAHTAGAILVATNAGIAPLLADDSCVVEVGDVSALAVSIETAFSGKARNKSYQYPYQSKAAYLNAYRADIERAK